MAKAAAPKGQGLGIVAPAKVLHLPDHDVVVACVDQLVQLAIDPGHGMGQALAEAFPAARAVFAEVDEALGQNLSVLMRDGPDEALRLTENAQPALMAVSLAAMRALESEFGVAVTAASYVAGHSLGEYSALAAAGAFSVADAARLLKRRGQAMQRAVPVGAGAMASLIGKVDVALAEEIAAEGAKAGV